MTNTISELLAELEAAMKHDGLWSDTAPDAEALASSQPFAVDTLVFDDWLQFIFIPRFSMLLHTGQAMPQSMAIYPAAEVKLTQRHLATLRVIKKLDGAVNG